MQLEHLSVQIVRSQYLIRLEMVDIELMTYILKSKLTVAAKNVLKKFGMKELKFGLMIILLESILINN